MSDEEPKVPESFTNETVDAPDILRQQVTDTVVEEIEITDTETGKTHTAREEGYSEAEIESKHLVKIAPLLYYCPDNRKVLLIPFSIPFSLLEALKFFAEAAHNIEVQIKDENKKIKEQEISKTAN